MSNFKCLDRSDKTPATPKELYEWWDEVFGFGYGTGEPHEVSVMHKFFKHIKEHSYAVIERQVINDFIGCYAYDELEKEIGPELTWILINHLCHKNIIEYGGSPRFGWLDYVYECNYRPGKNLTYKVFWLFQEKTPEQITDLLYQCMEDEG